MTTPRILGPVAIQGEGNRVVSVDLGTFVARILLSEAYVLQSVQPEDLILLTRAFDETGILTLFQTGALKLYYQPLTIGQTGQARADLNFRDNNKRLPLCSYSFSQVRVVQQEERFEAAYRQLSQNLQDVIKVNRIFVPEEFNSDIFGGFYGDIRRNPSIISAAVRHELTMMGIKPKKLELSVEETAVEDFKVKNNLESKYGLSEQNAHKIIERAILAVADLNVRFVEMKTCDAVSGIAEGDLPVLQAKLGAVASLVQKNESEKQFERIGTLMGLRMPVFGQTKVDAEKLLKIRESDDCRAFRDWLTNASSLSDKEVKDRTRGLNAQISRAINSETGRAIRFLVSAGLSFAPHTAGMLGLGASVVDSFIVQKLAPRDAVVAFLSERYPSVFKHR
jgi:hypothetical protein